MNRRYLSNFFDGPGQCFACHSLDLCLQCTSCKEGKGMGDFQSSRDHLSRGQYQSNLSAPVLERCWNFKHIMDAFNTNKTCAVCFIFGKRSCDHVITICPLMHGTCVKCSAKGTSCECLP